MSTAKRIDIVSDTHGRLSSSLLKELRGADLIIHAGDITSEEDWECLKSIAPIRAVMGNNDYFYHYGPEVEDTLTFEYEGLKFFVSHYREEVPTRSVDVGVCGHTHVPRIERVDSCIVVNPGSPTFPRTTKGPTMARMYAANGEVISCKLIQLDN